MPRGRPYRRKATVGYGKARVSYEWMGFRDGGVDTNLDVLSQFELVPPAAAGSIGIPDVTCLRIVGDVTFRLQSGVTANTNIGVMIGKRSVSSDQVVDELFDPLSNDVDSQDLDGIMFWRTLSSVPFAGPSGDADNQAWVMPIDIRVARKLDKRDTIVIVLEAGTTARIRAATNLRVLTRSY